MTMINQLLKVKGHGCFSVSPGENVYSAIKKMAEMDIGSVLVMDGAMLVGILTERDYARNIALKGRISEDACQGHHVNACRVRRAGRYCRGLYGAYDGEARALSARSCG